MSLIEIRDQLNTENQSLKRALEYKQKNFNTNKLLQKILNSRYWGGIYNSIYANIDFDKIWKDSFFEQQRVLIETLGIQSIEEYQLGSEKADKKILGYVEIVGKAIEGVVFKLADPTGSIILAPYKRIPFDVAITLSNRIIVVHLCNRKSKFIKSIQVLSYKLHEN